MDILLTAPLPNTPIAKFQNSSVMCHPSFKLLCSYQLNLQNTVEFAERESQKKQWLHVGRVRSANQCWFFFGTQIVLFTAKKKFIVAKTIAEKAVTANIIPQSRIYSKKYLNIYLKNHYTTVLNLFFELTDSSKYSIFSIPSCTSWPTNSSSNVSTSCHSSNQPFQMAQL